MEYHLEKEGSTLGAAILLKSNLKLIGIFKENHKNKKNNIIDYCIPINLLLGQLNFIKCIFSIEKSDIGQSIKIFNNGFDDDNVFYKKNDDVEKKLTF